MFRTKNHALFREKEEELKCSNKKVKNVRHADFTASHESRSHSQGCSEAPYIGESSSFKDNLLGEIPRATTKLLLLMKKWKLILISMRRWKS